MGKFITNFATTAELATASAKTDGSFGRPHVSLTKDDSQVHFFGDPCKSEIVKTTYELVDLGLPSGLKWANKNIGALSVTDYGQYFQWGDIQGFTADQVSGTCKSKTFNWANYKYSNNGGSSASDMTKYQGTGSGKDGLVTLESSDDAATINAGGSFRMPTETEFNELLNTSNCTKAWTTNYNGNGINGYLFTSVRNSNTLFFPAAGFCNGSSVYGAGSNGGYWSSSLYASNVISGMRLFFYSGYCRMNDDGRYSGCSVRGVVG